MIVTIKSKLLEHLSNIDSLASVYDYHVASPESYPCATFECESIENLVQDSCNHNIKYTFDTFIVVLIDEITDRSTARGILDTVVDEIIDETNKNYTLGGTCEQVTLTGVNFLSVKGDKGYAIACNVKIVCEVLDFNN